jgi:hypothetical protein
VIDRSTIWIAFADIMLCMLGITIAAVNPPAARPTIPMEADYFIVITWDVNTDADVDNWLHTPKGTVFYEHDNRQVGCVTLDMDNHGTEDSQFQMADGTTQKIPESKEIITLHCSEPGHYDQAVHLYGYRGATGTNLGLKVHVEVDAMKPSFHPVFSKDVTLDYVEQTINVVSFDLDAIGDLKLAEPPLKSVTDSYYHQPGGANK